MDVWTACLDTICRSFSAVIALQLLARVNGAKQISQLSFYDYITGITIGSMAAVMAIDDDVPFFIPLLSMTMFVGASYVEGKWTLRSLKARKYIEGIPMIIMSEGNIVQENMKKAHLTVNDLLSEARVAGYFDLSQISYAIMENSGKISFLPHQDDQTVTCKDLKLPTQTASLYLNVIIDGVVLHKELSILKKDQAWLLTQLEKEGISSIDEVLLAIAAANGTMRCYRKNETAIHHHTFL